MDICENVDIRNELKEVDRLLSRMTVSGGNVMLLALSRQKLAEVYQALAKKTETEDTHG